MKAGVVFGYQRLNKDKEKIYCVESNTHTIEIGATRSGKTRCIILQTLGLLGLAGESVVVTDPKGELYDYTADFYKNLGYDTYCLDFKNTKRSDSYNFLQPVVDALNRQDIQDAVDKAWDITESIMPENDKGEPIWKNGEASIIATCILVVAYENQSKYKFQNLCNVYKFIIEMAISRSDNGNIYVYFEKLRELLQATSPDNPAIDLLAMSEVAHPKTRSSFYISALTTLKLFTNANINRITSSTTIPLKDIGKKKVALFIILPDEKTTYYSIASLFVNQLYISLVEQADRLGGKLKNRVNVILEEFGNFTKIPDMNAKLTVSGSRGIRFNLSLQNFAQLDEKYGKESSRIIRYNCENWIYLQTDDNETLKELSEKIGNYTTTSYSLSSNENGGGAMTLATSSGSSTNLISRNLLTPDEIKKIRRPNLLYISRKDPCIMECPDISKWNFNKLFGMGDEEHNTRLRFFRSIKREEENECNFTKIEYWQDIYYKLEKFNKESLLQKVEEMIQPLKEQAQNGDIKASLEILKYENYRNKLLDDILELNYKIEMENKEDE